MMKTGAITRNRLRGAAFVVMTLFAAIDGTAVAKETVAWTGQDASVRAFMPVYGQTLPPIGFVQFCRSHPGECSQGSGGAAREHLTEARWDELVKVNDYVNAKVAPVTDEELYQVPELWTYPDDKGDCEDYVLLKRRYLVNLGWSTESLLITVVRDRSGDGHAVLTVVTDLGEFILDNQNTDILPWQATRYRFQKRQSQTHPSVWVTLQPENNEPKARGSLTGVLEVPK
jgi:predicted transglutaminase-like cysteine proteinase